MTRGRGTDALALLTSFMPQTKKVQMPSYHPTSQFDQPIPKVGVRSEPKSLSPMNLDGWKEILDPIALQSKEGLVEEMLINRGYIIKYRVIVADVATAARCKYIVAVNRLGHGVFIELNATGFVNSQGIDKTIVSGTTITSTSLPYDMKMKVYETSQMDTCGVAFVSNEGLVSLKFNPETFMPSESSYKFLPDSVFLNAIPVPYPIIKLTEILHDDDFITKSVDETVRRIQNSRYDAVKINIEENLSLIEQIHSRYSNFYILQSSTLSKLIEIITMLEDSYNEIMSKSEMSQEDYQRLNEIIVNLHARYEILSKHISIFTKVAEYSTILQSLDSDIERFTKEIYQDNQNTDFVLSPEDVFRVSTSSRDKI